MDPKLIVHSSYRMALGVLVNRAVEAVARAGMSGPPPKNAKMPKPVSRLLGWLAVVFATGSIERAFVVPEAFKADASRGRQMWAEGKVMYDKLHGLSRP